MNNNQSFTLLQAVATAHEAQAAAHWASYRAADGDSRVSLSYDVVEADFAMEVAMVAAKAHIQAVASGQRYEIVLAEMMEALNSAWSA